MRFPRLRISWVMGLVAVAALNLGAIRALSLAPSRFNDLAIVGILPMASVLGICVLLFVMRRGNRPFLLGFEAFGAIALLFYVAWAIVFPNVLFEFIRVFLDPVWLYLRRNWSGINPAAMYGIVATFATIPQVLLACWGGWLSTRFKVVVVRRNAESAPEVTTPRDSRVAAPPPESQATTKHE